MTTEQNKKPFKPSNEIDLQVMTTTPHISGDYMSDNIKNKFKFGHYEREKTKEGKEGEAKFVVDKDFWTNIEIFTQDFRLGNLSKEELYYTRYHLDLFNDILTTMPESFAKPAFIILERAVSVNETSQGKGGFLRRLFNTFFQHSTGTIKEETGKRNFFGFGKKKSSGSSGMNTGDY